MTPSSTKESEAVKAAFGISSKPSTETAVGGQTKETKTTETAATKEAPQKEVRSTEQENGKTNQKRVIEVGKTTTKEVKKEEQSTTTNATVVKHEFDEEKFLSEKFGLNSTQIREVGKKLSEYEERLKVSPYKSKVGEMFDDLVGNKKLSPDFAIRYINADPEKMTPKEIKVLKMQLEMPEVPVEKIVDRIDRQYKLGKYAPSVEGEDGSKVTDEQTGLDDLMFDTAKDKKEFATLRNQLLEQGASLETLAHQQTERKRIEAWQPVAKQIFDDFKSLEFDGPSNQTLKYAVELDGEERAILEKEFQMMVSQPNFVPDEEGIALAKQVVQERYAARNLGKLAFSFAQQARSMTNEEWISVTHNPSALGTGGSQNDFSQRKGDRDDAITSVINKAEGGRRRVRK